MGGIKKTEKSRGKSAKGEKEGRKDKRNKDGRGEKQIRVEAEEDVVC